MICLVYKTLHHSTHSWGATHWHLRFLFGFVNNQTLCGEEHTGNRSGIFKSYTSYLGRINDTGLTHIFVLVGTGIVTEVALALANLLNDNSTLATTVNGNLAQRLLDSALNNVDTSLLVGID